jgi:hypothetical protein
MPTAGPEEEIEALRKMHAEPEAPAPRSPVKTADRFAQAMVLALLLAAPALICVRAACANDPDIWWHLRTGEWMLQHHALPRVDPFSAASAGKPWAAYSWLFELVVVRLFERLGLVGLVGYSAGMVLGITVAVQHLVRRLLADFSIGILLTFATCFSLSHLYTPRPWLFSVLFFVLEVDILMHARRTGRTRELMWLPLIFALWSNLHIQFIDGLAVLALAAGEAVAAQWAVGVRTRLRAGWAVAALGASALATLANPYGWHIYGIAHDLAAQTGVMDKISELQAIPFRSVSDFLVLFLAMGAAAALAWRRRFALFEIGLLMFAAVVSFRSQRDVWVMAVAAAAILASTVRGSRRATIELPRFAAKLAVVVAGVAVLVGFRVMHVNNQRLETEVAKSLPVHAVEAVRAQGYGDGARGPLYNDFNWGGYLIWALRMPVSIDGRAAFYGDEAIDQSMATWNAEPDWASDPQLKAAGVVIGPVKAPLTQVLRMDPGFRLMYEDELAAVFVARR